MSKLLIKTLIVLALLSCVGIGRAIAEPLTPCDDYESLKDFAKCEVSLHWNESQWDSFDKIIQKESSWTVTGAHDPKLSSAFGLAGFLDRTWEQTGYEKTSNERIQILAAIEYISIRYKTSTEALELPTRKNWY